MDPVVEYLSDAHMTAHEDRALRELLCACYTRPIHVAFHTRRYLSVPCPHHWIIRGPDQIFLGHVGVFERYMVAGGRRVLIGGIGTVCVAPAARGRGYVRRMLAVIHEWLPVRGAHYSVLYGRPQIYGSSGYTQVQHAFHGNDPRSDRRQATAMIKPLRTTACPSGDIYVYGEKF